MSEVRLETERLMLAPLDRKWREDLIHLHREPAVAYWLYADGNPPPDEEAETRVQRYEKLWTERGYGFFAVLDKASGAFVGRVGPMLTPDTGRIEIAWTMSSKRHGKGFATEAARAAIAFVFANSNLQSLDAYIRPDNVASQAVAAKLGFEIVDLRFLYNFNLNYYRLPKPRN